MNAFMKGQIVNIISMVKVFKNSCKMAALKDDGVMNREEEKQMKKINEAADRFIKELEKVMG